jgi:hypothetical protein
MSLEDDVLGQLKNTGEKLKKDLWDANDLLTLKLLASDLVGLNSKIQSSQTDDDRRRYRESAGRVLDHAALLALSKMNVAGNDVLAALKAFFMTLVSEWLPKLLPFLLSAL